MKGIPHPEGYGRGDQYAIIKLVTPTDLSEEKKGLMRQFNELKWGIPA